ncbi:MAG: hypothetical protein CMJ35_00840 [Phycisphaerae bacterium]|nr:hypothetical protein [Phycisphaerae bacterium]
MHIVESVTPDLALLLTIWSLVLVAIEALGASFFIALWSASVEVGAWAAFTLCEAFLLAASESLGQCPLWALRFSAFLKITPLDTQRVCSASEL